MVQPPPLQVVSHEPKPQRNSQPPPLQVALHDEPVAHCMMHPPPEHVKSHCAPPWQIIVQPRFAQVLLHWVPPWQSVTHAVGDVDGQVKSQENCSGLHTLMTPLGEPVSLLGPPSDAATFEVGPTAQS